MFFHKDCALYLTNNNERSKKKKISFFRIPFYQIWLTTFTSKDCFATGYCGRFRSLSGFRKLEYFLKEAIYSYTYWNCILESRSSRNYASRVINRERKERKKENMSVETFTKFRTSRSPFC